MNAVILAGGFGLRLRDAIGDVPKPMACINGKPFLEYLIMQLSKWHLKDVIIAAGYKNEVISSYFGDGHRWGVNIGYSKETEPLGTGGALKKAASLFKDDDFIAMNGDSFLDLNFSQFISFHKNRRYFF